MKFTCKYFIVSITLLLNNVNCLTCQPGYYAPFTNNICEQCPLGSYPSKDLKSCLPCPDGSIVDYSLQLSPPCKQCEIGKEPSMDRLECLPCPDGTFRSDITWKLCLFCPDNSQCTPPKTGFQCSEGYQKSTEYEYECVSIAKGGASTTPAGSSGKLSELSQLLMIIGIELGCVFVILIVHCSFKKWAFRVQQQENRRNDVYSKSGIIDNMTDDRSNLSLQTLHLSTTSKVSSRLSSKVATMESDSTSKTLEGCAGIYVPAFLQFSYREDLKMVKKVTSGGTGKIFLAVTGNPELAKYGHHLIVKKLNSIESDNSINAFRQELSIMYLLRASKYIAKLAGFTENPYCLIMKHYENGCLSDILYRKKLLTRKQQVQYLKDIIIGLSHIFEHGIAHGDMKTSNVLMECTRFGSGLYCCITDFGLSCFINEKSLNIDGFKRVYLNGGSFAYASPELLIRLKEPREPNLFKYNPALSDIYSFGVIIFAVLTRLNNSKREFG